MKRIVLHSKNSVIDNITACGECFAQVDYEDEYCWSCGIALEDEAYCNNDLTNSGVSSNQPEEKKDMTL